ncbi:hypothetical protein [Lewinella sp. W8]|uniref:hypothetical protein n=1 Tax=Lewinella sp. W8 TaxID=2528208 RepID=UPI00106728CD|nr:hypothetical protein [Lewinella sp. W8]MTB50872.1 hypothetical protein [Lewinella sp. W8]
MSKTLLFFLPVLLLCSCGTYRSVPPTTAQAQEYRAPDPTPLTSSLFTSNQSTISEEDIQRILDGTVELPEKLRVAVLNLDSYRSRNDYYFGSYFFRSLQAQHFKAFSDQLGTSGRAQSVNLLPQLLVPADRNIFSLRESAVRMQADVLLVFTVGSDLYSEFKLFKRDDLKAYATAEALLLDVRTGIIVFAQTVSTEATGQREESDTGNNDVARRVQAEASAMAIEELARQLSAFLKG